jgi:hypothetical protein
MTHFKAWLEAELSKVKDALAEIPPSMRKGPEVAMLRHRARMAVLALDLHQEYESAATPQNSRIGYLPGQGIDLDAWRNSWRKLRPDVSNRW